MAHEYAGWHMQMLAAQDMLPGLLQRGIAHDMDMAMSLHQSILTIPQHVSALLWKGELHPPEFQSQQRSFLQERE